MSDPSDNAFIDIPLDDEDNIEYDEKTDEKGSDEIERVHAFNPLSDIINHKHENSRHVKIDIIDDAVVDDDTTLIGIKNEIEKKGIKLALKRAIRKLIRAIVREIIVR